MIKKIIAISLMLSFANFASAGPKQNANDAIKAAASANRAAKKVHYEWRDTGKMLKKAKKAVKNGKYAKASKLAKKAHNQAVIAQKQALDQSNPVPRYQS